jgi:hypothetical protein
MSTITFDTHASFKRLKDAGLNEAQAEAVVEVVSKTAELPDISQLATKADLASVKADLANVETKLDARITALKGELIWWIIGTGAVVVTSQTLEHIFGR